MKQESLLNVSLVMLVACAAVTTALVVRREVFLVHPAQTRPRTIPEWRDFSRDGHRMGPQKAPVTIVVFSDFQCPYCALLMDRLGVLRAKYPRDVAVVYRHYPLVEHRYSMAAARASECAASQGLRAGRRCTCQRPLVGRCPRCPRCLRQPARSSAAARCHRYGARARNGAR